MSSLLDLRRRRTLWTDFERNRYLRALVQNTEERLRSLEAKPGIPPGQIDAEKLMLHEVRKELRRTETRLNDL